MPISIETISQLEDSSLEDYLETISLEDLRDLYSQALREQSLLKRRVADEIKSSKETLIRGKARVAAFQFALKVRRIQAEEEANR